MMAKFLQLLEESVITQSVITFMVVATVCVMWGLQITVPQPLLDMAFIVVAFWMGSKVGYKQGQNSGGS